MQRVREQVQVPEQLYDGQSNTSPAVIAVLDTGIAYHPDLAGKLLCFADFVEKGDSAEWHPGQNWSWGKYWMITGRDPAML